MVYTPYDPHSVTMESVGAVQDTNVRHKADIVAAADGIEEESGVGLERRSTEAVQRSMVEDGGAIQTGDITVQLMVQPHECTCEVAHEAVDKDAVVRMGSLQVALDGVFEHFSDGGSKAKFICKPNQGSKSWSQQRARKQRLAGSGVRVPKIRSSYSHHVKPQDNVADQRSHDDNENRCSTNRLSKKRTPAAILVYDDGDSSTTKRQSPRGDDVTPCRRLAFTPIPPSELNIRMGSTLNSTPDKHMIAKSVGFANNFPPMQVVPTISDTEEGLQTPIISLQQTEYVTPQVLRFESETAWKDAENTPSDSVHACSDEENTIESALQKLSAEIYGDDDSNEYHDSDKENIPSHEILLPGVGSMTLKLPRGFNMVGNCSREPLQTLYSAPSTSMHQSCDVFNTPTASQQLLRVRLQVEAGRQWHMVIDTDCLLNVESLESLKRLEGILETRLVIPNIVVRELDNLQKKEDWRPRASFALQWIESCMLKSPSWIHVQSPGETVHVAMTPPVSPSIYSRGLHSYVGESDLMHPTLHDHVLECALFQKRKPDVRVAILTDDIALKIKALAEDIVVDTAINLSDSLLNPYSNRFVYAGSTPVLRTACRPHVKLYDRESKLESTLCSSILLASAVHPKSRHGTPRPTSRANFFIWHKSRPLGLQALLA